MTKLHYSDTLTVKVLPELSDIDIFFATLEKLEQCVASLVIPPLGRIASTTRVGVSCFCINGRIASTCGSTVLPPLKTIPLYAVLLLESNPSPPAKI